MGLCVRWERSVRFSVWVQSVMCLARNSVLGVSHVCASTWLVFGIVPALCHILCFRRDRSRNGPGRPLAPALPSG